MKFESEDHMRYIVAGYVLQIIYLLNRVTCHKIDKLSDRCDDVRDEGISIKSGTKIGSANVLTELKDGLYRTCFLFLSGDYTYSKILKSDAKYAVFIIRQLK